MRNGITKENLLLNINLEVKEAFKTQEDMKDDWKKYANKYTVKISYFKKDNFYVTDYYMGSGLNRKPSKEDILNSMLLDDVKYMSFEDFCWSFGYDNDSIKALKTYEACQRQTEALYKMFDAEELETLKELLEN